MTSRSTTATEFEARLPGVPASRADVVVRVRAGQIVVVDGVGEVVRDLHTDDVDEVRRDGSEITIEMARGAALILTSDHADALDTALVAACCALPEFTRAMHSLGSSRARTNAVAQREFLSPLLEARRRAEESVARSAVVAAFDADKLRRAIESYVTAITQRSTDTRPAARRAFGAAAADVVEPLLTALEDVGRLASAAAMPPPDSRVRSWRRWCRALQALFAEADRGWLRLESLVVSSAQSIG